MMAKPLLQAMVRWLVVTPVMDVVPELGVLVVAQVTADGRERAARRRVDAQLRETATQDKDEGTQNS